MIVDLEARTSDGVWIGTYLSRKIILQYRIAPEAPRLGRIVQGTILIDRHGVPTGAGPDLEVSKPEQLGGRAYSYPGWFSSAQCYHLLKDTLPSKLCQSFTIVAYRPRLLLAWRIYTFSCSSRRIPCAHTTRYGELQYPQLETYLPSDHVRV